MNINMKADEKILTDGPAKATTTVADFLKALPTAAQVKAMIEQNKQELKRLKKMLAVVEGE